MVKILFRERLRVLSVYGADAGEMTIERVHEYIIEELQQNIRTDTIFILTVVRRALIL